MRENLLFLRNRPTHFNLGDFLCTPMHYFDFGMREHQTRFLLRGRSFKTILGGGAFNDLGVGHDLDFSRTVAWGVGSSHHGGDANPTNADNLPYLLYGVRDRDAVSDDEKFVPCVSCLHPYASLEPGRSVSVFLNYYRGITDLSEVAKSPVFLRENVSLHTNNEPEMKFMKAFAEAGSVITNSFHVAYWSLLSGRRVSIIGYSSKFRSLMKLAGLPVEALQYYSVENQTELVAAIERIYRNDEFHHLPVHDDVRNDCVKRNMRFADRLVEVGFVPFWRLKPNGYGQMRWRQLRYLPMQWISRLANRDG